MNNNIKTLLKFMPTSQAQCFLQGLCSSEHKYYEDIADKMSQIINNAPALYDTDNLGEAVKPVLHYFYGNSDIYITEIDKESDEHFGYVSLGLGYLEGGYVDLKSFFKTCPLLNLDFYFEPLAISEYRKRHHA